MPLAAASRKPIPVQDALIPELPFAMGADAGQVDEGVAKHDNDYRQR